MVNFDDRIIKVTGLSWLPWIGKNYVNGEIFNKKILILVESHYGTNENSWFNENLNGLTIQEKIGEIENNDLKEKVYNLEAVINTYSER